MHCKATHCKELHGIGTKWNTIQICAFAGALGGIWGKLHISEHNLNTSWTWNFRKLSFCPKKYWFCHSREVFNIFGAILNFPRYLAALPLHCYLSQCPEPCHCHLSFCPFCRKERHSVADPSNTRRPKANWETISKPIEEFNRLGQRLLMVGHIVDWGLLVNDLSWSEPLITNVYHCWSARTEADHSRWLALIAAI